MTEQNKEEILEIDAEQLQELIGGSADDKLPPIEIPFEFYDTDEFYRGIHETSYLAGKITAILNAGFSEASALDLILSMETVKHNIKVAEINRETSVEVSKNAKLSQEKYEL
jgi:hypothetical protein